jgi:cell division septal protein FtsQ
MPSYRKKHIKGKIHRIKPKKSIFKKLWFWILFLILIIVLTGAYFILFYSGFQIKNIIISGNQKVLSSDIKNLASNDINSKILYVINSKSIFLVDNKKINKDILDKFSEIEKVNVKRNFPQTLTINIAERKEIGTYCPSASSGQAGSQCFLIDENGIIFEQSAASPDSFIIRQILENGQANIGQEAVAKDIMSAIYEIKKNLKDNFQINLKTAMVASSERLNIATNENWQIYFDLSTDSDINSQITKLNLLLKNGISSDSRKNLRYIDLRPKDRAIVCDNRICGR